PVVAELRKRTLGNGVRDKAVGAYYIQHADSFCENIKDQSRDGVIKALKEFDWEKELKKFEDLGRSKGVPPSLFLGQFGDDLFVHIVINNRDDATVIFFRPKAISHKKK